MHGLCTVHENMLHISLLLLGTDDQVDNSLELAKLEEALPILQREDPSLLVFQDEETGTHRHYCHLWLVTSSLSCTHRSNTAEWDG